MKKQMSAMSAPAKYMSNLLNFVFLLLPKTANVRQLPKRPKPPTTDKRTPSTQNLLVLKTGA